MTQPIPTPPPGDPTPTPPAPVPTPPPADPPKDDKPLGPGGEKALAAERAERKKLADQLAKLAPLADLLGGAAPTGNGKTDLEALTERFAKHEQDLAAERAARLRLEVAAEKGLTPAQAARLQGSTRDELVADAAALVSLFPAFKTGTPAPDPSQGARGGTPPDLDVQIAEAQKKGDVMAVIRLNGQKLAAQTK